MNTTSILIVGVGGQGTLLSSRIMGQFAVNMGEDVKVSEVHGMAQRGGSVVTYVRMGGQVASPIIETGGADYMLAFEKLEALRYLPLMKKTGHVVVNTQRIDPMPVISGTAEYPDAIIEKLSSEVDTFPLDAAAAALEAGSIKVANTIMIGKLAAIMGGDKAKWLEAVSACVPSKTVELNEKAFNKGYEL